MPAMLVAAFALAGCASPQRAARNTDGAVSHPSKPNAQQPGEDPPAQAQRRGGYYQDDGPGDNPPANLDALPDAAPRVEPYARAANRPYNVFGTDYLPDLSNKPYKQRGIGSWYGRKFHGQRTASGEIYDMYAMTAAHPTLPIPSYARVTNVANGRSVVVRVNDRGPFLHSRIMDLSYAAAYKIGYAGVGSATIEVEHLLPRDIAAGRVPMASQVALATPIQSAATRPPATVPLAPSTSADLSSPTLATSSSASLALDPAMPVDLLPVSDDLVLPAVAGAAGFYLQLGAFRARAGADSFASHVSRQLDQALAARVQVSDYNGFYRVRVGPYADRVEADTVAQSLRATIEQPVVVVPYQQ